MTRVTTQQNFSILFIAPEIFLRWNGSYTKIHGEKSDVFSLGLTLLIDYLSLPQKVLPNPEKVSE